MLWVVSPPASDAAANVREHTLVASGWRVCVEPEFDSFVRGNYNAFASNLQGRYWARPLFISGHVDHSVL